jgi:hypothetical protein
MLLNCNVMSVVLIRYAAELQCGISRADMVCS